MKIECVKEKLVRIVGKAEKITAKSPTLAVLSCIQIEAKDNQLTISSTNLDLGITASIPVKVIEEGLITIPATIFSNFLSSIVNDKNIVLETKENTLKISTDHTNTTLKTVSSEDFPLIPKNQNENSFVLNSKQFIKGLKSVQYSASHSTIKPALASVYLYTDSENLIFVATDSFRLAEKRIKLKKPIDIGNILIPLKNIPEIIRVFEDIDDDLNISIDKNQISFEVDNIYLTSRLIDATFPDYKQIIPQENKTEVVVLKQDLVNSLKISNIFADKFSQIYISVSEKPKKFEIKTKNTDIGENTSDIEAVIKGQDLSMSFNYKYIIDCFQSMDSDSITLYFTDVNKAVVFKASGDNTFLYLVMPMNK